MRKHDFTLYFRCPRPLEEADMERLHELGFDDASFGSKDGVEYASFHRRAHDLPEAILAAIRELERALPEARVIAVEGDELVTASKIAERTERSRESVRLLIEGKRGPGGFPPPVPWLGAQRTRLYEWREVVGWFSERLGQPAGEGDRARFIAALNAALAVRDRIGTLNDASEREAIAAIIREDFEPLASS